MKLDFLIEKQKLLNLRKEVQSQLENNKLQLERIDSALDTLNKRLGTDKVHAQYVIDGKPMQVREPVRRIDNMVKFSRQMSLFRLHIKTMRKQITELQNAKTNG